MLGGGDLEEAVAGDRGLLAAIDACLDARCLVSTIVLIYSAIDAVSALTRPMTAHETSGQIFQTWVTKYMKNYLAAVKCSAEDIWAARCGVVHTARRASTLSRTKATVKTFVYYWRHGPRPDAMAPSAVGATQLCVEDLRDAFIEGLRKFGEARTLDPDVAARVAQHEQELLCYRPWSSVEVYDE